MNRNAFFEWILDHRAYVLLGLAAVVSIAGWGARRVTIDYGVEQFFLPQIGRAHV